MKVDQPMTADILNAIGILANTLGWYHNDGSGGMAITIPTATDVGAIPTTAIGMGANNILQLDSNGRLKIGGAVASTDIVNVAQLGISQVRNISYSTTSGATQGSWYGIYKSHSASETLVTTVDTEVLGTLAFGGVNSAGTPALANAAFIRVIQNGTQAGGDTTIPADLVFYTSPGGSTAATERARIKANGQNTFGITTQTDQTASRAVDGTVYQNTGTKPLFVSLVVTQIIGFLALQGLTDASNPPTTVVSNFTNMSGTTTASFVVLPGNYYKVTSTNAVLANWVEWS